VISWLDGWVWVWVWGKGRGVSIVLDVRFMASGSCWRARRAKEGEGETWVNSVELLVWPISVCVLGEFDGMYNKVEEGEERTIHCGGCHFL